MMNNKIPSGSEWIYEALRFLESRPGLYLSAEDVVTLDTYLRGWCQGRYHCGKDGDFRLLDTFSEWLSRRPELAHKRLPPRMLWASKVAELDQSPTNIRVFYEMFKRFLAEEGLPPL